MHCWVVQLRRSEVAAAVVLRQIAGLEMADIEGFVWIRGGELDDQTAQQVRCLPVVETYDFTHAMRIAAREFAPDLFIVTGPGTTLGGAVAQSLILSNWRGMASKAGFQRRQEEAPMLVSMGMAEQRPQVVRS